MADRRFDFNLEITHEGRVILQLSGDTRCTNPRKTTAEISEEIFGTIVRQMKYTVRIKQTN